MDIDRYQIMVEYLKNKKYPQGYTTLQKRTLRKAVESFFLRDDDKLYHLRDAMYLDDPERRRVEAQMVVVGNVEKIRLVREAHGDFGGGHCGQTKTVNKIAERFWWPGFSKDVIDHVRKCAQCRTPKPVLKLRRPRPPRRVSRPVFARPIISNNNCFRYSAATATATPTATVTATATASSSNINQVVMGGDDDAVGSLASLNKSVLLLQKQVYENKLKLQAKKDSAVDEFRRYIAEMRMKARGIDLSDVPVEIPPGLDTAVLEHL